MPASTAAASTNAVAAAEESSTPRPNFSSPSVEDRAAVVALESLGSLLLVSVAFRDRGGKRRAAEDASGQEEEDYSAATATEPRSSEGTAGDDNAGGETLLEKMSANASSSSALVQSIRRQIVEIDAKLASFGDEEMKELLRSQTRDLEEMLCFALDNDL